MINYKRHRRAIEKLYEDTCTVSRMIDVKKPSGETRQELQSVHIDQKCKLSQKSLASNQQTESTNNILYETKLFIAPELEIKQGDTLVVTHCGRTLKFTTGEPFVYGSHQEISLQREDKA
ncbi:hypothetical protein [Desulfosporosinus youngiae]|uniref:Uncharacterized protein n=1 Tax=Desulfosporosinus youngiae DSM 17734 TaxID=768710 RepID=H5XZU9_9FIRM|nr:hypothetical protein [Desulfosporosinus youngiae]EHQ92145.1 hypothetical protein DesyoDRAFT_5214 [Desulfosporosinus youngiae DSM 17734]